MRQPWMTCSAHVYELAAAVCACHDEQVGSKTSHNHACHQLELRSACKLRSACTLASARSAVKRLGANEAEVSFVAVLSSAIDQTLNSMHP